MGPRCGFDDLIAGRAFELVGASTIVEAFSVDEVLAVLSEVDRLIDGATISRDSSLTSRRRLRPALTVGARDPASSVPLVWFAAFDDRRNPRSSPRRRNRQEIAWEWNISAVEYRTRFAAVQEEIAAGWTYQVNLTGSLGANFDGDPLELNRAGPCPTRGPPWVYRQRTSRRRLRIT